MAEKEVMYASKIKTEGILSFKDFYKFCYEWLSSETNLIVIEDKYGEKLKGNEKEINIEWTAFRKVTDYFKFEAKIKFRILRLVEVEIEEAGKKIKMNKGEVEINVKGTLVRDWQGKFEKSAWQKFYRGVYEKWVIPARVEQMEDKLVADMDEFLEQAKAYLALEGRK